jgi:hypothetical protein
MARKLDYVRGEAAMTFKEIGAHLGLTPTYTEKIYRTAIAKLRYRFQRLGISPELFEEQAAKIPLPRVQAFFRSVNRVQ